MVTERPGNWSLTESRLQATSPLPPPLSWCFDASVLTGPSGDAPRRRGCLPSDGPLVTTVTVRQPVIVGMMLEMSHAKYADLPADAPADTPASSDSAYLA